MQCVGCHSAAPDGLHVAYAQNTSATSLLGASLDIRSIDQRTAQPSWLSPIAKDLLARPNQSSPAFSRAHFDGSLHDRIELSVLFFPDASGGRSEIVWTDLEAQYADNGIGWGVLQRRGDDLSAAMPFFSHDGNSVVYVHAGKVDGGISVTDGDILLVPYASRQGGQAMPVPGAHDPAYNEYAPSFSPDDAPQGPRKDNPTMANPCVNNFWRGCDICAEPASNGCRWGRRSKTPLRPRRRKAW